MMMNVEKANSREFNVKNRKEKEKQNGTNEN